MAVAFRTSSIGVPVGTGRRSLQGTVTFNSQVNSATSVLNGFRLDYQTSDHRVLMPGTTLLGGILALSADLVAQVPGSSYVLPLNSITALIGTPVVIWVILSQPRMKDSFSR